MSSLGRKLKRSKGPAAVSHQPAFTALAKRIDANAGQHIPTVRTAKGETRMSDLLSELIEPYIVPNETYAMRKTLLMMGMVAWNATLLDTNAMLDMLAATTGGMAVDEQQVALTLISALSDRKTALFPNEKRFIVDFELKDTGSAYSLVVASAPAPDALSPNQETILPADEDQ